MSSGDSISDVSAPIATLDDVRRAEARRLLTHLAIAGPATRTGLAEASGLSRQRVSALVPILEATGLVETVSGSRDVSLVGRHGRLVTIVLGSMTAVATVAGLDGDEHSRFVEPYGDPGDYDHVLDVVATVLRRALGQVDREDGTIADVVLVVPATVAGEPQLVVSDTAFGWGTVDVLAGLRERLDFLGSLVAMLPGEIRLETAGRAAGLAERENLPQVEDLLYIGDHGGISSAIIARGRLVDGGHGLAGDLAHLPIDYDGIRCGCGQRGCLTTVAGPDAILERAGLADVALEFGREAALDEFVALVHAGDDRAKWAWLDASMWIGRALQLLAMTLDPSAIVLGGAWGRLREDIVRGFNANRPVLAGASLEDIPPILVAESGPEGVFVGARADARGRVLEERLTGVFG
ncbi:ROK family transcriptional regulator [Agromyces seonyuensis]|uniref:ROK family protein n=1 Tax=Agromyces seonyuensis TaxID=2662446 RepID=A0A6I4NV39_9MICO|nr:ROK family transcriptional regulator [Agromyces seonyuensis]MWB97961.1 ROK family protein [Agromyces seonyuensis]